MKKLCGGDIYTYYTESQGPSQFDLYIVELKSLCLGERLF